MGKSGGGMKGLLRPAGEGKVKISSTCERKELYTEGRVRKKVFRPL